MCSIALFLNRSDSVKMEAKNQLSESEDENIVDPITVAVNSGESLNAPQGASIARNRKLPTNKGINKQIKFNCEQLSCTISEFQALFIEIEH